jgi:3-phenylpropionate/trans-cinnamate dioxygenase ferredoxin subunit
MKALDLQGARVAIANVDGVFYAFSDVCPHAECSLSQGQLEGMVVICGSDGSRFDLSSGHALSGPAQKRVRTYRIQIQGDDLII